MRVLLRAAGVPARPVRGWRRHTSPFAARDSSRTRTTCRRACESLRPSVRHSCDQLIHDTTYVNMLYLVSFQPTIEYASSHQDLRPHPCRRERVNWPMNPVPNGPFGDAGMPLQSLEVHPFGLLRF